MSLTYVVLNKFGARLSPEYSRLNLFGVVRRSLAFWFRDVVQSIARFAPLGPLGSRWLRPRLYRLIGVKVGRKVHIGPDVFIDLVHPHLISIGDGAGIAPRVTIFAHERDLSGYVKGSVLADVPYHIAPVRIGRGASLGTGCIVLPGAVIGDGAIIAAGTLVNKEIPPYTLAAGYPAKVLKTFPDPAQTESR